MKKIISILSILMLPIFAYADTATTNLKANASINNTCTISAEDVSFGVYQAFMDSHQQTSQNISILCTRGTSWTFYTDAPDYYLSYGGGQVNGYTITSANQYSYMKNDTSFLLYQVLLSSGEWQPDLWKDDAKNGAYRGVGTGVKQDFSISYRILKNQYAKPGNYSIVAIARLDF